MATRDNIGPLIYDPTAQTRSNAIQPITPIGMSQGGGGTSQTGGTTPTSPTSSIVTVADWAKKGKTIYETGKKAWDWGKDLFSTPATPSPSLEFPDGLEPVTSSDVSPIFQSDYPTEAFDVLTGQLKPEFQTYLPTNAPGDVETGTGILEAPVSMYEGMSPATFADISGAPIGAIAPAFSSGIAAMPTGAGISAGIEGGIAAGTTLAGGGTPASLTAAGALPHAAYLTPAALAIAAAYAIYSDVARSQKEKKMTATANNAIEQALTGSPEMRETLFKSLAAQSPNITPERAAFTSDQSLIKGIPNHMVTNTLQDMFKGDTKAMDLYDPTKRLSSFWNNIQAFQTAQNARQEAAVNPIFNAEGHA